MRMGTRIRLQTPARTRATSGTGGLMIALMSGAFFAAGCAAPAPSQQAKPADVSRPSLTSTDPCAMRLHEVCGALLLYYNAHHALPPTVAAIEANSRQYVPSANKAWEDRFPGIFHITDGTMDTSGLNKPGLGAVEG